MWYASWRSWALGQTPGFLMWSFWISVREATSMGDTVSGPRTWEVGRHQSFQGPSFALVSRGGCIRKRGSIFWIVIHHSRCDWKPIKQEEYMPRRLPLASPEVVLCILKKKYKLSAWNTEHSNAKVAIQPEYSLPDTAGKSLNQLGLCSFWCGTNNKQ